MQDRFKYRNKFNVGDDVWVLVVRSKILKAKIKDISYYNNGEIKYFCFYDDGGIGFVSEKEIFTTKEEAQQRLIRETKRRTKKNDN